MTRRRTAATSLRLLLRWMVILMMPTIDGFMWTPKQMMAPNVRRHQQIKQPSIQIYQQNRSVLIPLKAEITPMVVTSAFHGNINFVLMSLLLVSATGVAMEQKTTFGKALSAPLVTMLISLLLANFGIIPFKSPVYGLINKYLVPLAVPLFLFDSDLRRVVRDAGSLLIAFIVGAVSTIIGTIAAFSLIPLKSLGEDGWKVACALNSRHIGGAINFVAVADTLTIDGSVVSAAIAADNVVVALYFAFLFYLAKPGATKDTEKEDAMNLPSLGDDIVVTNEGQQNLITTSSIAYSVASASCLVTIGEMMTRAICPSISSMVITSILTVLAATCYPKWFQKLRSSGSAIGILFLQLFFAASGASGSLVLVLRRAPSLIAFSVVQIAFHFIVLMFIGRGILRLDPNELYLASNANVGGPTTAAAMAQAKEWNRLTLPALLVGVFGYATATALSLSLGPFLTTRL